MLRTGFLYVLTGLFLGCNPVEGPNPEDTKAEVRAAEAAFDSLAAAEGVKAAFLHFAADEAVLNRNNQLIKGKDAIADYFDKQTLQDVRLSWQPDFVEVAASGDLAYTYGKFTFSAVDTAGKSISSEGIFHTVWKRQPDGSWKFVYD